MRICINGVYRDMTAEEVAAMERLEAEMPEQPHSLEEQVAELREALDMLLSGVTE